MKPGDRYGEYDVIRLIGQGNMGSVYLMTRRDTGEQVAVKVVTYADSDTARENIAVEERGAKIQRGLTDPRVVKVIRVHKTGQDLNVEMEYIDGTDLSEIIGAGPLDPPQAVNIAIQLCDMLRNLADAQHIVHGDLKPRNIRVLRADTTKIKVMDFGIAKQSSDEEGTDNPFRTVRYASPERLETSKASEASDLWSVSVILYEMLAGYHPFRTAPERILSNAGPDRLPGSAPQGLCNILHRALSRVQTNRYAGPAEMLEDLERFRDGKPLAAPDPNPDLTERTVPEAPVFGAPPVFEPSRAFKSPPTDSQRRFGYVWPAAGSVALVLLLVASWQYKGWSEVRELTALIEHRDIQLKVALPRFDSIRTKFGLMVSFSSLQSAMKKMLIEEGERPINDYRRSQANSREGVWQRAVSNLKKAREIDPTDQTAAGDWYVCQGHYLRIRSKKAAKPIVVNERLMTQATEHFLKAAELISLSPDPYLGLARIYYELQQDTVRGDQAIAAARDRGLPESDAPKVLKAEALRVRGEREEARARGFRGDPGPEKKNLEAARQDFQDAYKLYAELSANGTVAPVTKMTLNGLKRVEDRLAALEKAESAK